MKEVKRVTKVECREKSVFLRSDLDVPILNGQIEDDSRLKASVETIDLLLENWASVIIGGHLGRPKGIDKKLSLQIVADWYGRHYKTQPIKEKVGDFDGFRIKERLFLLENLRFFEGEEKNDLSFSKKLASLADIYVNDAFAVSHRNHASIVGVCNLLPHYAGVHLAEEISVLSKILDNPKRPLIIIIGGAKIETKLPLVKRMSSFADSLLVGGLIAKELKELLTNGTENLFGAKAKLITSDLKEDTKDITGESANKFREEILKAKTIVWNGVVGLVEEGYEEGTKTIAQAIINSGAESIVGGGDTVGYLRKAGLLSKFSFVSTGGGAMLEFLSGEKLPGIEALRY